MACTGRLYLTDIAFYYCIRCSTVTRTSTLLWQILGSNPCSENEFSRHSLMCSQDRGTGLYPKPTVYNLQLLTQKVLKTNLYISLSYCIDIFQQICPIQIFRKKYYQHWQRPCVLRASPIHPRFLFENRVYDPYNVVISCTFKKQRTLKVWIYLVKQCLQKNSARFWRRYVMCKITSFIGLILFK